MGLHIKTCLFQSSVMRQDIRELNQAVKFGWGTAVSKRKYDISFKLVNRNQIWNEKFKLEQADTKNVSDSSLDLIMIDADSNPLARFLPIPLNASFVPRYWIFKCSHYHSSAGFVRGHFSIANLDSNFEAALFISISVSTLYCLQNRMLTKRSLFLILITNQF
jgi:hypothetical protein